MSTEENLKFHLSLVVPCYCEEPHLESSINAIEEHLRLTRLSYEIIFVEDCGPDDTRSVIERLCEGHPNRRYVFHKQNKGRGGAFKTGAKIAKGDVIGFLDIDLEVPAHYILPAVSKILDGTSDIVTGNRTYLLSQTGGLFRTILSRSYRWLMRRMLQLEIRDSETGFKFFNRKSALSTILSCKNDKWFWDTEVMARASYNGLRIYEMPVLFLRRKDKKSTVRVFRDSIQYFRDLRTFRKEVGFGYLNRSPIYWHPTLYRSVMGLLYRGQYSHVLKEVADYIKDEASVVELCAGPGDLFRNHLKKKKCSYLGLDFNQYFVQHGKRNGIQMRWKNVLEGELPDADYVVIVSSLYHFQGQLDSFVEKLRRASKAAVLICEPTENLSKHRTGWVRRLAQWLSNPGVGTFSDRFSESSFREIVKKYGAKEVLSLGRSSIAVLPPA